MIPLYVFLNDQTGNEVGAHHPPQSENRLFKICFCRKNTFGSSPENAQKQQIVTYYKSLSTKIKSLEYKNYPEFFKMTICCNNICYLIFQRSIFEKMKEKFGNRLF